MNENNKKITAIINLKDTVFITLKRDKQIIQGGIREREGIDLGTIRND